MLEVQGKNSAGTTSGSPYTNSATESLESSLGVVLRPRRTHGNWEVQEASIQRVIRAAFKVRCILSTRPLASGLYAVVR